MSLLEINNLNISFDTNDGVVKAVNDVSFNLGKNESLAIVGESGSGKTTLGMALLRLLPSTGQIRFGKTNIHGWENRKLRPLRRQMQIVFQDPFSALNPLHVEFRQLVGVGNELRPRDRGPLDPPLQFVELTCEDLKH
jgi:microcin C transport system ATP-binding protein